MSKLKKPIKGVSKEVKDIDRLIEEKEAEIKTLSGQVEALKTKRLEHLIRPFKLGDRVYAEVNVGRAKKKTECVLEAGEGVFAGTLYLRPFKNDGNLSGKRYSLCPLDRDYSDILESVK